MTKLTQKIPSHPVSAASETESLALQPLLTYPETAAATGWALGTLYAKVARREIPFVRLGPRSVRFRLSDIRALVEQGYHPPEAMSATKNGGQRENNPVGGSQRKR